LSGEHYIDATVTTSVIATVLEVITMSGSDTVGMYLSTLAMNDKDDFSTEYSSAYSTAYSTEEADSTYFSTAFSTAW